jgi:hypothetical protein
VNVELAAPSDFVPVPAGWEERSLFIADEGPLAAYHYDPYAQALAKVERGHTRDLADVRALVRARLVDPTRLRALYEEIEPELYRYPAVDPPTFRRALDVLLGELAG